MNNLRNRFHKQEDPQIYPSGWITTFNDLMTQLMVFFVLIFSLSTINILDIQSAQRSLQTGLGIFEAGKKTSVGLIEPLTSYDIGTATFVKQLEETIGDVDRKSDIGISYTDKGIIIALDESLLFNSGSAKVKQESFNALDTISKNILNKISNPVRVEGHTDNVPIMNDDFASNWELSTARAVNVLKYLADKGNVSSKRLSAVGYGESKPLSQNNTDKSRKKNRRVDLVITTDEKN